MWHYNFMAGFYIFAGVMHFIKPAFYHKVMPDFLPAHGQLIFWSGVAEVACGMGMLFTATKNIALWGIILMLCSFFLIHIPMLWDEKIAGKFPYWLIILRIPLQFGLIYWAWSYL